MLKKGDNYNFGRVVYLTIGKLSLDPKKSDPYTYRGDIDKLIDTITIAFDPLENPQLNTRIDFFVRNQYRQVSSITRSACSIASIDIYNIGPALESFIDAYNVSAQDGKFQTDTISKYCCTLQVGYHHGGEKQTIFAGVINSYNVERLQSDTQVDTVWHLYAAGTGGAGQINTTSLTDEELAVSGRDYTEYANMESELDQSYKTGEDFIKAIVMKHPRDVGVLSTVKNVTIPMTYSVQDISDQSTPLQANMTFTQKITNQNFDRYFKIIYKDDETRRVWKNSTVIPINNIDCISLQNALQEAARIKKSSAVLEQDPNTGLQNIYISLNKNTFKTKKGVPWVIYNFERLLKPPTVSGRLIQFTMLLQPSLRTGDTIELRVRNEFSKTHKYLSFDVDYGGTMGNWSTAFAGANFIGLADIQTSNQKVKTIKGKGNIFNKPYQALFVVHRGSTHTPEWSTQADCSCTEEEGS